MRIATITLVLLSLPAFSGDYRSLDFGSSCENVVGEESALGARAVKWRVEGMSILAFEGMALDRKIVFTYFCPRGVLLTGDYYFPSEPLSAAVVSYEAAYKKLSAIYGAPFSDNTPWRRSADYPDQIVSDPLKYMTTWRTSRVSVTALFLPSQADEPSGWRVAVHFGGVL